MTDLDERVKRYKWLLSQERWHLRQPPSAWHRSQARWFRNKRRRVYLFSDLVTQALRDRRDHFAESVASFNQLIERMKQRERS